MKPYIYLRGLRHVDLSVFCVESASSVRRLKNSTERRP